MKINVIIYSDVIQHFLRLFNRDVHFRISRYFLKLTPGTYWVANLLTACLFTLAFPPIHQLLCFPSLFLVQLLCVSITSINMKRVIFLSLLSWQKNNCSQQYLKYQVQQFDYYIKRLLKYNFDIVKIITQFFNQIFIEY